MRILCCMALLCMFFAGCATTPQEPAYQLEPPDRRLDYLADVEPILVKRCVVCHSCYNSPCQLKLSSWDGLERGASKEKIYNGARLKSMDPSRLLVDAHSEKQWREKGFYPVTGTVERKEYDESIMYLLLDHKRLNPDTTGVYYPEADDLTCAETKKELDGYLKKHPNGGMPFGFPPLKKKEFNTVAGWLIQGALGPSVEQQAVLKEIPASDRQMIDKWEQFLNNPDAKYRMTARYLYEHLFLAHISFETGSGEFYELVRSFSGPGRSVDIIATVRPYDAPGSKDFYYRFRKIYSTIVYKTHMVFPFGNEQYTRIEELFIKPDWPKQPHIAGYNTITSANPFVTFEQIPARSRYQWLLDNAQYNIMTFIRGPVCKGQIALNVINDHFWLMFLDPDHDLSIRYPGFLKLHYDNLRMPIERGSDHKLYKVLLKNNHYKWAIDYYRARQQFYGAHYPDGLDIDAIWKGNRAQDQPLLTVFRYFDSASVHRGPLGNLPKTIWVLDYPLLERIYYALVAGFDIYGNAGHQLSVRLYMDALRIEGESYFLDFMPSDLREKLVFEDWYTGVLPDKIHYHQAPIPSGTVFFTGDPKREFIEQVVKNHVKAKGIDFDQNYLPLGQPYPSMPEQFETMDDYVNGFIAASAPGVSFFSYVANYNANVAWIRVKNIPGRDDVVISSVVDRWHDNVKFLAWEDARLNPQKDRADFIKGFIGSYPNYFFVVDAADLPDFFEILMHYDGSEEYIQRLDKYGVNRADDQFWDVYDWFQQKFYQEKRLQPGLIDLNRYYHFARNIKEAN